MAGAMMLPGLIQQALLLEVVISGVMYCADCALNAQRGHLNRCSAAAAQQQQQGCNSWTIGIALHTRGHFDLEDVILCLRHFERGSTSGGMFTS